MVAVEHVRSDLTWIFFPLKTPKTLNDSGMVVSVQEAVTPSQPEYSESLKLKSFIQLELKITVLHIIGGS